MSLLYNYKAYYNRHNQLRICYINQYKDHYKICYCKPDDPTVQYLPYVLYDYDSAVDVQTIWLNKHALPSNKVQEIALNYYKLDRAARQKHKEIVKATKLKHKYNDKLS